MVRKDLPRKLNFAGGWDRKPGYLTMDIVPDPRVDVVWDFNKFPYPFPDNQFTEIYASHALEHVDDLLRVMQEFSRILAPGGVVKVLVPYFASPNSHRDPTHKIWFTSMTFSYVSPGCFYNSGKFGFHVRKKKILFFSNAGFMKSRWYSAPIDWFLTAVLPVYERFFCYWFPASEIHFLLVVEKSEARPAPRKRQLRSRTA